MPYIIRQDDISVLPLSARSRNCLHRANIHTIGELLDYPQEKLINIHNMGKTSVKEIHNYVHALNEGIGEFTLVDTIDISSATPIDLSENSSGDVATVFVDETGAVYQDMPVLNLSLSVRAQNCLKQNGYEFVSQLIGVSREELMHMKSTGTKTADEILNCISQISLSHKVCPVDEQVAAEDGELAMEMFSAFGESEDVWLREILTTKAQFPEAAGETFIYRFYENFFVRGVTKTKILQIIEQNDSEISRISLDEKLPKCLGNTTIIEELLLELESSAAIELGDVMIVRQYPSVAQFISQLKNERVREVLELRIAGKTLQEIGDQFGVTRERVRQLSQRWLSRRPFLREDKYADIYNNYDFSAEDLMLAFDEPKETFNYLEMISTNPRAKRKPIEEILTDDTISPSLRKKAEKAVYKRYITVDGTRVRKTRPELVKHFVKVFCKSLTKYDDFVDIYHAQLDLLGLSDNEALLLESRAYENTLNHCDYVLWNQWRRFRYYNIPEREYDELLDTMNLNEYENTEISTLKLFRDYPELMEQYDIRDEYELHNLLKKVWKGTGNEVNLKKMPTIEIGQVDRDGQVLSLLLQYAPISGRDFAQRYEETYGIKANAVQANYMTKFDAYYFNGVYSVSADNLPPEQYSQMQHVLNEDFYVIREVKRLYLREFPNADLANINPYTLKTLGFRVYSGYTGYVVSNIYSSGSAYFNALLTKDDIVDLRDRNHQLCYIGTYQSELYGLRADYEIIEYLPLRYINIKRLNTMGISKDTLRDYCSKVSARCEKGEYFTVSSICQDGFSHSLDDLGFDEWFYSSILVENKELFSYQRIGGTRIFLRGKPGANLGEMMEWLLERYQKIELYDLVDLIKDRYGIVLPKEKILEIIRNTELYYDSIMEAVYIDYDTYFEEI